jgi:uncharacterized lipoprotein YmbA
MKRLPARAARRILKSASALAGAALCGSCGHTAPTEFLTLRAVPSETRPAQIMGDPVRVIALRVPSWLDRLEVARPTGTPSLVVEDFERWSAPIGDLALSALTEDLADRLPGVAVLPNRAPAPPATRDLSVDLMSLTGHGETVELDASVTVTDARTGALVRSLPVRLEVPGTLTSATGEALALDRLMGQLADRLAPELVGSRSSGR